MSISVNVCVILFCFICKSILMQMFCTAFLLVGCGLLLYMSELQLVIMCVRWFCLDVVAWENGQFVFQFRGDSM